MFYTRNYGTPILPNRAARRARTSTRGQAFRGIIRTFTGIRRGFEHLGRREW